ncbi:MAG: hypothetical protein ABI573_05885 [Chloroflexota bacterium]
MVGLSRMAPVLGLAAVLVLSGCGSAAPSAPTGSSGPSSAPASPTGATASQGATPGPTVGTVAVDLVFSGARSFVAKGSAGQCNLGRDSSGAVKLFGFGATEVDYPGLGQGFYIDENTLATAKDTATIKWLVDGTTGFLETLAKGIAPDHKSMTLDVDLVSSETVHVSGTIACP